MNFADIDIEALFGLAIGFGLVVVLPIVALLLAHQRRMAEVLRRPQNQDVDSRIASLQTQLDELRIRSADQALALDDCQRLLRGRSQDLPPRRIEI